MTDLHAQSKVNSRIRLKDIDSLNDKHFHQSLKVFRGAGAIRRQMGRKADKMYSDYLARTDMNQDQLEQHLMDKVRMYAFMQIKLLVRVWR